MATFDPYLEEADGTRAKAVLLLGIEVASVLLAIAIVVLLVTQPWSTGWEIEPRSGGDFFMDNQEPSGQGR